MRLYSLGMVSFGLGWSGRSPVCVSLWRQYVEHSVDLIKLISWRRYLPARRALHTWFAHSVLAWAGVVVLLTAFHNRGSTPGLG
jgi:hypothetical protein